MSDCPSPYTNWPDCQDWAVIPRVNGWPCDEPYGDGSVPGCFFFYNPYGVADDPCVISTDPYSTRCSGDTNTDPPYNPNTRPWWYLEFATDNEGVPYRDFENTQDLFLGRERYLYIVQPWTEIHVCPCTPLPYCDDPHEADGHWLSRILLQGRHRTMYMAPAGWSMQCNPVKVQPDDQYQSRLLTFGLDPHNYYGQIFIRINAGASAPGCFEGAGHFCFSRGGQCGEYYDCHTQNTSAVSYAVDKLVVDVNPSFSTNNDVFPHSNPYEVILKNAAWYGLHRYHGKSVGLIDKLDNPDPAHDAGLDYDAIDKNCWVHSETFDEDNPGLSNMGVEPYPPVVGVGGKSGGTYSEYANKPIPITCRSSIHHYQIDAELTYYQVGIMLQLHVEREVGGDQYRVFADADVYLTLRVKLLPYYRDTAHRRAGRERPPNNLMQAILLTPEDPFDLRLKDPQHTNQEHPHEVLIAYGPNGERVPRRMRWVGLRSTRKYSNVVRGANSAFFAFEDSGYGGALPCCDALHAIHGTYVFGAHTDCSDVVVDYGDIDIAQDPTIEVGEEHEQWYQGYIRLQVQDILSGQVC